MVSSALPCIATTPVTPQIRAFTAPAINLSNRAVIHREYDRWGNLTLVDDPRTQPDGTRFRAANTTPLASLFRLVVPLVLPATERLARAASLGCVSRS